MLTLQPLSPSAVLRLIRDWQQQHGIRFGDYQRYRGYCTRRLGRLRKVLKLPQADKRHFKKRDVTTGHLTGPKADIRYLHVPLMMAERAWAFAMALRQESNTEPRKRFHLINKLRKSCFYALQLQELCNVSEYYLFPFISFLLTLLPFPASRPKSATPAPNWSRRPSPPGCTAPSTLSWACSRRRART